MQATLGSSSSPGSRRDIHLEGRAPLSLWTSFLVAFSVLLPLIDSVGSSNEILARNALVHAGVLLVFVVITVSVIPAMRMFQGYPGPFRLRQPTASSE